VLNTRGAVTEKISTGYSPRKFQALLHQKLKRFNVLVCHRRFGKTVLCVNHAIDRGLRCPRRCPQIAYIAPTYGQAKRVAWDMFKHYTSKLPNVTINEAELRIEIQRPDKGDFVRLILLGAENPGSLKGIYLDGVILDEYAECTPSIWDETIRPALSDRLGWAIFIGTPKGNNHFYDKYIEAVRNQDRDWFAAIYRASETGILPQSELDDAKSTMGIDTYNQEYECSFTAAIKGSYYGDQINELERAGRIASVPWDPVIDVDTSWDLGIGDSTAIWFFQSVGLDFHVIDYLEQGGQGLPFYAQKLREKPYVYRDHFFPHDAAARDLSTGKAREQTLRELGIRTTIMPRTKVEDRINAARLMLPRCRFDKVKCDNGLKALSNYQRHYDEKRKAFNDKPLHDWSSHGADAFGCGAMGLKPADKRKDPRKFPHYVEDKNYDIFGG
jgi:hypothetical protein